MDFQIARELANIPPPKMDNAEKVILDKILHQDCLPKSVLIDLLREVEGMGFTTSQVGEYVRDGYNEALEDVIQLIKEKL